MIRLLIVLIPLCLFLESNAQINRGATWSYSVFLGGSNMLGDLGGGNANSLPVVGDIDVRATRPAIGVGIGRHWNPVSLTFNVNATYLYGNDLFTNLDTRAIRNLNVRTDLIEANLLGEIRPFYASNTLSRFYLFGGVGGIYYQPKAELNNEWHKLRPLTTEGQNYAKFSLVIPYGAGYKFPLGSSSTLNLELGMRKTYTDYLDDVSTVYVAGLSELGAQLADRSENGMTIGNQRGNPNNNDSYFIIGLKFEKTIGSKKTDCYYDDIPKMNKMKKNRKPLLKLY